MPEKGPDPARLRFASRTSQPTGRALRVLILLLRKIRRSLSALPGRAPPAKRGLDACRRSVRAELPACLGLVVHRTGRRDVLRTIPGAAGDPVARPRLALRAAAGGALAPSGRGAAAGPQSR